MPASLLPVWSSQNGQDAGEIIEDVLHLEVVAAVGIQVREEQVALIQGAAGPGFTVARLRAERGIAAEIPLEAGVVPVVFAAAVSRRIGSDVIRAAGVLAVIRPLAEPRRARGSNQLVHIRGGNQAEVRRALAEDHVPPRVIEGDVDEHVQSDGIGLVDHMLELAHRGAGVVRA